MQSLIKVGYSRIAVLARPTSVRSFGRSSAMLSGRDEFGGSVVGGSGRDDGIQGREIPYDDIEDERGVGGGREDDDFGGGGGGGRGGGRYGGGNRGGGGGGFGGMRGRGGGDGTERRRPAGAGMNLNRVDLLGGIASDPVRRQTRDGKEYALFTLITNRSYERPNGEVVDEVEPHNVVAFGPKAGFILRNVQRGTRLFVSGRLHYRNVPAPGGEDGSLMVRHTNILAEIVQVIARGDQRRDDDIDQRHSGMESEID